MRTGAESSQQLRGSLLHLLDRCSTAAGGRMLRRWLAAPLADRAGILDRQQAVQVGVLCVTDQLPPVLM
jgi:DNA mismatch repair ATPase MutS